MGVYVITGIDKKPYPPLTVLSVAKDSPAEKAGILPGDKLLKINNQPIRRTPVTSYEEIPEVRRRFYYITNKYSKRAGIIRITLNRGGTEYKFDVAPELVCNAEPNIPIVSQWGAYVSPGYPKAIFVTAGAIAMVRDDAKVALIFGHELAHITRSHIAKKMAGSIAGQVIGSAVPGGALAKELATQAGGTIGGMMFSHKYELEADYVGLYHAAQAGYDVQDAAEFFYDLAEAEWETAGHSKGSLSHPSSIERFSKLKETIREIREKKANGQILIPDYKAFTSN